MKHFNEKNKELISAYLDGALNQEETSQVEDLILNNKEAQQYYKELQGLTTVLGNWEDEDVSLDLTSKVQKSLLECKLKENIIMSKPSFIKQMTPVLTMAIVVIVGMLAMQVYVKRGTQGRLKQAADNIGSQYTSGNTSHYRPYEKSINQPSVDLATELRYENEGNKQAFLKGDVGATGAIGDVREVNAISRGKTSSSSIRSKEYAAGEGQAGRAYIGKDAKASKNQLAKSLQYEPHYLSTDYEVSRDESDKFNDAFNLPASTSAPVKQKAGRVALENRRQLGGFQESSYGLIGGFADVGGGVVTEQEEYWSGDDRDGARYRQDKSFNTETYERIYENQFLEVAENPLSTFSIDVDTASYANLRRFLNQGQLPPKDSVRIEEMINYFTYNYPQPKSNLPFSVTLKGAPAPWNPNHNLVLVGLQGQTLKANQIPPSNLVFLIDVSGSMRQANKLPLLKDAFKMMVNQLGPNERVAIVVYAGAAGTVLESTPGSNKRAILSAIDRLQAGGSTAGGAGIKLAYNIAKQHFIKGGNNRVILATDGDFNVGVSSNGDLVRMIEEKRKDGVFLTTLGFGTGNYKDSRMEQLANKGNGNHYYIDTKKEAKKVLVRELGSTLFAIAKDVKLQIEFNPAQVKAYRLIGYENRMLKKEDFNDDTKDAGELGAGHTVTALYEIVPAHSQETFSNVDPLKYIKTRVRGSNELMTVKLRYKKPDEDKSKLIQESIKMKEIAVQPDDDFKFASAVAEFGMIIRDSQFKGNANFTSILQRAHEAKGSDVFGYRAEFIGLVERARTLIPEFGFKNPDGEPQSAPEQMFFKGSQNL